MQKTKNVICFLSSQTSTPGKRITNYVHYSSAMTVAISPFL